MAVQRFKLPLNAARFPLISSRASRAVCVPQLDAAPRTPRVFMGTDESIDYDMPQIIYCENVMPTSSGIASVGYRQRVNSVLSSPVASLQRASLVFPLRDQNVNVTLFAPQVGSTVLDLICNVCTVAVEYSDGTFFGPWSQLAPVGWYALDVASVNRYHMAKFSYAYVDGKTFVAASRILAAAGASTPASIRQWTGTAFVDPAIANLPFPYPEVDGVTSSMGNLIVWSGLKVAWAPYNGTTFDFNIFANGNYTGAGSQVPEELKANITACVGLPGGFVIFTSKNAVAATYNSQNLAAPWSFREISGAGGVKTFEQITVEGSLGYLYAHTTTGLQKITLNSAESFAPDVSDYLAGRETESYNFSSHTTTVSPVPINYYTKLTNAGNRFLVISCGLWATSDGTTIVTPEFSHALVYDLELKRWGKLAIQHTDCLYFNFGSAQTDTTYAQLAGLSYETFTEFATGTYDTVTGQPVTTVASQQSLGFLNRDYSIRVADWSNRTRFSEDEAVAIIGRTQISRSRRTELQGVEVEGLKSGRVYVTPSEDGYTLSAPQEFIPVIDTPEFVRVEGLVDCVNFNTTVEGTFNISTLIVEATTAGMF